jgi:Acetyltransferase (GNAT) family
MKASSVISKILKIHRARFLKTYQKNMNSAELKALRFLLFTSLEDKQLNYEVVNGELTYYFRYYKRHMGELQETFFHVSDCYCVEDKGVRKKFYAEIKKAFFQMKKKEKIKKMMIDIDEGDLLSKRYFFRLGKLTYVLLVGKTQESLKALGTLESHGIKISTLKKSDIKKVVKMELDAHIKDKTSRMHEVAKTKASKESWTNFFNFLANNETCFIAKNGSEYIGVIGYFVDSEHKRGMISCVSVASHKQGLGLSKLLYKRVLQEFAKNDCEHFLGSSTTTKVLKSASHLKRKESARAYIVKY